MKLVIDYGYRKENIPFYPEWTAGMYAEHIRELIGKENVRVYIEADENSMHDLGCTVFTGD